MTAFSSSSRTTPLKSPPKKKHSLIFRLILRSIVKSSLESTVGRERYLPFSESITGDFPSDGNVILATCDDNYFQLFATDFIRSIELLGAPQQLHLHLLEPSDAILEEVAQLRATLKHVRLTFTVDPCVLAQLSPTALFTTPQRDSCSRQCCSIKALVSC